MNSNVPDRQAIYFRKKIIEWGKFNFQVFPWRYTKNKFHALTAEIMLQRTKADQVAPAFVMFCKKYNNPSDYLKDENSSLFHNLGLSWRERLFRNLCVAIKNLGIPEEKDELMKLPCVGDYIAAAYRSLHLNFREPIIDSNIVRIYGRFFGFTFDGETRRKKWFVELADRITPKKNFKIFNYGLLDFSRNICSLRPQHDICPLKRQCKYYISK